jgi:ABC-type transporter Mla subunit MlaD
MRYTFTLLFLFLLFSVHQSLAQSSTGKRDSLLTTSQVIIRKTDSTTGKVNSKLNNVNTLLNKVNNLDQLAGHAIDSISNKYTRPVHKLDSLTQALTTRIDSLQKLQLATLKYTKLLDSLIGSIHIEK